MLRFVLFCAGDQHEYCKSDNSDSNQATEKSSARKNTFQTQQGQDNSKVAYRKENHPTAYGESPSTSIVQQVSKQIISTGSTADKSNQQQQRSTPSPGTTSIGSTVSTAIRAESNFDTNFNAEQQSKRSVTVEKPITATISAVTAPLTSSKLQNNNNRNISDL